MKKLKVFLCFFALFVLAMSLGCKSETIAENEPNVKIFYIDHELLMLVPVSYFCAEKDLQRKAEFVLDKLREGQDFNRKIKRQIPNIEGGMTVKVHDKTAYVNLSREFVSLHPEGRVAERLSVYQIVNSLTSVDGIDSVCFTIDKKIQKRFLGFLDMRETFFYKSHVS